MSRSRSPSTIERCRRSQPRSSCSRRAPMSVRRWASRRPTLPVESTPSSASRSDTSLPSSRLPVDVLVADAVLTEVSEAAADVGIAPGSDEATEIARRLAEVQLGD